MTDTTPTPADRPADGRTTWPTAVPLQQAADLRRAAGDPLLADWLDATANALAWLAPYRDNEPGYGMWEAALAVARQLLGTTEGADVEPPADRRARYEEALWVHALNVAAAATAAMAVADAEQASLRAEAEGLDEALRGAISASEKDGARLRAELAAAPPAPADRAAVLAEVDWIVEHCPDHGCVEPETAVCHCEIADRLRRLADDAAAGVQPPTTSEAQTEAPEDAARRFARRLHAVELLCSGRPGYHTITVKALLTAMSEADDEQPAAPAAPEEQNR
ncbi:hypothetical protein [Streptomyces sp. NE06-03C]|uniref:hypothetical protein n=1 Tax=Streptomyces sp. NE06-03C TaxID=3028694 RepID=UPI0029BDCEF0|nr:hypothetical protein [Streptomyces sp. NE06-03C]MDX2922548.1 hypothetical protein [Streptomyces sp. NE06-03C]